MPRGNTRIRELEQRKGSTHGRICCSVTFPQKQPFSHAALCAGVSFSPPCGKQDRTRMLAQVRQQCQRDNEARTGAGKEAPISTEKKRLYQGSDMPGLRHQYMAVFITNLLSNHFQIPVVHQHPTRESALQQRRGFPAIGPSLVQKIASC